MPTAQAKENDDEAMAAVNAGDAPAHSGPLKPRKLGRYVLHRELASGGMASVWLARQHSDGGFSRVVAIKQLFPQFAKDPQFVAMFRDEARVAARIRHPNVVPTIDVVVDADDGGEGAGAGAGAGEVFIVMEYVAGDSLARLLAAARRKASSSSSSGTAIEPAIASAIVIGVLEGLHAAHQATNERGIPLKIVHRDVSPQNVLVGIDGVPRVVDFGIAKAVGRQQETTQTGQLKGKICYMAPEQIAAKPVDRRCDLWATAAMLWEMLAGRPLFKDAPAALRYHATIDQIPPVVPEDATKSSIVVSATVQAIIERGLARAPGDRFATARDMIAALEKAIPPAPTRHVAQWVQKLARDTLRERAQLVEELEALSRPMSVATQAVGVAAAAASPTAGASAEPITTTTVPLIRAASPADAPESGTDGDFRHQDTAILPSGGKTLPTTEQLLPSPPPGAGIGAESRSSQPRMLGIAAAAILLGVGCVLVWRFAPRATTTATTATTTTTTTTTTNALPENLPPVSPAPQPARSSPQAGGAALSSSSSSSSSSSATRHPPTTPPIRPWRPTAPATSPPSSTNSDPLNHDSRK